MSDTVNEQLLYGTQAPLPVTWLDEEPHWRGISASPRDLFLARRAKKFGAKYSLRIIWEARRAGVPISALFALIEKESKFSNVYGHDDVSNRAPKGGTVTKDNWQGIYLPDRRAGRGMQGAGPSQLTWYEFQDRADRLGGAWVPRNSIRVGAEVLGSYYKKYKNAGLGTKRALQLAGRDFNGAGASAEAYGRDFVAQYDKWHNRLT